MNRLTRPSPPPSSRRQFLKNSVAAVSATSLLPIALRQRAYAGANDVIRVGLIGCGDRGGGAAVNALNADPGARLVAMADLFSDRLQEKFKLVQEQKPAQFAVKADRCFVGFDGYQHVIENSDVVLIACASKFHPKYLSAAIAAGKHVFVEKPHAIDPPGVRQVMAACEAAKEKKLCVVSGLMNRYHTAVRETMKRVHDGAIGDIVAIEENYLRGPYRLNPREAGLTEIQYQFRNWYHFSWLSGDDVTQSLVHNLDKSTWALGGQAPVRAHGLGGRSSSFGDIYGDAFDHHSVVYEYTNGVRLYAFCRTQVGCHGDVSDLLIGTKGRCDLLRSSIQGENPWRYQGPPCNPYDIEHQELFAAIRSGTPLNNGDFMARSTMVAILGQIACYTGKLVSWEDALKSNFTFGPPDGDFSTEPAIKPDPTGNYPLAVPGRTKLI